MFLVNYIQNNALGSLSNTIKIINEESVHRLVVVERMYSNLRILEIEYMVHYFPDMQLFWRLLTMLQVPA